MNASSVLLTLAGNDPVIFFNRLRTVFMPDGTFGQIALTETKAIMHLSMATVKDKSLALNDVIRDCDQKFGEIKTGFTRQRDAENK